LTYVNISSTEALFVLHVRVLLHNIVLAYKLQ